MAITIYADGASRGNPGKSSSASIIRHSDGRMLEIARFVGTRTCNSAEYASIIDALKCLQRSSLLDEDVIVRMDSKLVIEQSSGNWKCKSNNLKKMLAYVQSLARQFKSCKFEWIPRELNSDVDSLCNDILDGNRRNTSENITFPSSHCG